MPNIMLNSECMNSELALSVQYLQKEMNDEVDFFLHADKQSFLHVYSKILSVPGQVCPKYPK